MVSMHNSRRKHVMQRTPLAAPWDKNARLRTIRSPVSAQDPYSTLQGLASPLANLIQPAS